MANNYPYRIIGVLSDADRPLAVAALAKSLGAAADGSFAVPLLDALGNRWWMGSGLMTARHYAALTALQSKVATKIASLAFVVLGPDGTVAASSGAPVATATNAAAILAALNMTVDSSADVQGSQALRNG